MPRIFLCLAIGNLIVLLATGILGLAGLGQAPDRHIVMAVFSLLMSCFTQVVTFTYFTVTGKLIAQAVHLGHFDVGRLSEVRRLKRAMTHTLVVVFGSIVLVTATGATLWRGGGRAELHLVLGCVVLLVHGIGLYRQGTLVVRGASLLDGTLRAYTNRDAAAGSTAQSDSTS